MNGISWIFTSRLNLEDYYQCLHKCKIIFDLENHLEIKMKENMLARFIIYNNNIINRLFFIFTYFLLYLIYRLWTQFTLPLIKTKLSIAPIFSAPAYVYQFKSILPVANPDSGIVVI